MSMSLKEKLDKAVEHGFHSMTAFDAGQLLKNKLESLPKYTLSELAEHITDYPCLVLEHEPTYSYYGNGSRMSIREILRHTKSRTQAYIKILGSGSEIRITEKSSGNFSIIPEDMLWSVGLTDHKAVVEHAISLGMPIDLKVKLEYPTLFVGLPDWAGKFEDKFIKLIKGDWGYHITKSELEQFIEDKHTQLRTLYLEIDAAVLRNPANKVDYERLIADAKDMLELYRWTLPLVSEGGIFYTGK